MEYPKWKHHAKHGAKLVKSHDDYKALGDGWGDDSAVWRPHLLKADGEEIKSEKVDEILSEVSEESKPKKGRKASKEAGL
jgi:hypothetical protein